MPLPTKKISFLDKINNSPDVKRQRELVEKETNSPTRIENINVEDIIFNGENDTFNSEDTVESIEILADCIESVGLISPISVVKQGTKYLLLSGERRTKAYQLKNWRRIPALVYDTMEEYKQIEILYQANLQTRELDSRKRFLAFKKLKEYHQSNNPSIKKGELLSEISKMMNISERSISRLQQLEREANATDIELLEKNEITFEEFRKRTLESINKQQREIDARKKILAKAVSPISYIDIRTNTVYSVIKKDDEDKYCTCFTNAISYKICVHMPSLPLRDNFEDAQVDLDIFATNSGFSTYNGDLSEFITTPTIDETEVTKQEKQPSLNSIVTEVDDNITDADDKDNIEVSYENVKEVEENSHIVEADNADTENIADDSLSDTPSPSNELDVSKFDDTDSEILDTSKKISSQIADFFGTDIYTGDTVRGALYINGESAYIITNIQFGRNEGKSKHKIIGIATEVEPKSIIRNDI